MPRKKAVQKKKITQPKTPMVLKHKKRAERPVKAPPPLLNPADVPAPIRQAAQKASIGEQLTPKRAYRFIVIGDLHLRRTDSLGVIEEDGLNTRLKDKLAALNYAVAEAVTQQATHIVLLGDIFEAVNPTEKLKMLFWQKLKPAIDANIWINIILGNHDTTGQAYNFAGDKIIKPKNIQVIDRKSETCVLHLEKGRGPLIVQFIPYAQKETILKWIQEINSPDIVFGHFEIKGAELAPDNCQIHQGIDRNVVKGQLIWLGHIHKFQEFRPGFGYIGSGVRCDFGEINNRKVFGVLDIFDDGKLSYVFKDIPQRPMYVVNIAENDPGNLYLSESIPDELQQKGILIKFVLHGAKEWIRAIDKKKFKKRFPNAVRVVFEDKKIDADRQQTEYTTSNIEDQVHTHSEKKRKGKEYLDVGIELAKKAQEFVA